MALLRVDMAQGRFDHVCEGQGCHLVRRGLRLDPAAGDLRVCLRLDGSLDSLQIRACPLCGEQEFLNPDLPAWEAQEVDPVTGARVEHPGSLVGTHFDATRAVVSEHHHGYQPTPDHVAAVRLVRAMQRHPHLAPHAPLVEQRPNRLAEITRRITAHYGLREHPGGASGASAQTSQPPAQT